MRGVGRAPVEARCGTTAEGGLATRASWGGTSTAARSVATALPANDIGSTGRRFATTVEIVDTDIAEVFDVRAQLFRVDRHYRFGPPLLRQGFGHWNRLLRRQNILHVSLPDLVLRHAAGLHRLGGISGAAPFCNCRARRAAPLTRLYLLWRASSIVISVTPVHDSTAARRGSPIPPWITEPSSALPKRGQHCPQPRGSDIRPAALRDLRRPISGSPLAKNNRLHLADRMVQHIIDQRIAIIPDPLQLVRAPATAAARSRPPRSSAPPRCGCAAASPAPPGSAAE